MGGLALLAKSAGHTVSGCDENVYPPMSTQLESAGIKLVQGWDEKQISLNPDFFVVGNVVSRGNILMEAILRKRLPYLSGPQWLSENILNDKWVLAVAGTHGKTTVSSMLAWILEFGGLDPSFLVGGVPQNFDLSARLTDSSFFIVEADEYDTSFFDKRSKFLHYKAKTVVLNNLEFDHADIFKDLAAIETQFHHFVRTISDDGLIILNEESKSLKRVLGRGCWTPVEFLNNKENGWTSKEISLGKISLFFADQPQGELKLIQNGKHNYSNALAAISAARHVGIPVNSSIKALEGFKGVKRRMELIGELSGIKVFHDFAHHPTAIKCTLEALRISVGQSRIIVVFEPRSNTMRMGVLKNKLLNSFKDADRVFCFSKGAEWDVEKTLKELGPKLSCFGNMNNLVENISGEIKSGDTVLVMSNGNFGGIANTIIDAI